MSAPSYTLSAGDVAERFGVHEDTVKRWAKRGDLRGITTPGGWWRFSEADLAAFVERRAHVPEAAS